MASATGELKNRTFSSSHHSPWVNGGTMKQTHTQAQSVHCTLWTMHSALRIVVHQKRIQICPMGREYRQCINLTSSTYVEHSVPEHSVLYYSILSKKSKQVKIGRKSTHKRCQTDSKNLIFVAEHPPHTGKTKRLPRTAARHAIAGFY